VTREKHYYRSKELPHLWVRQQLPKGECYCPCHERAIDNRYMSYGTCIAERVNVDGNWVFILDAHSYSVTTTQDQNGVHHALSDADRMFHYEAGRRGQYTVLMPDRHDGTTPLTRGEKREMGKALMDYYGKEAAKFLDMSTRARRFKGHHLSDVEKHMSKMEEISNIFGVKAITLKGVENIKEDLAKAKKVEAERQKVRLAQRMAQEKEDLDNWLKGLQVNRYHFSSPHAMLRVSPGNPDEVQTTKGASVPLEDVKRAIRWVRVIRAKGEDWRRNGEQFKVGHYDLDSVTKDGVVAGCHRFQWEEVDRFAALIGL